MKVLLLAGGDSNERAVSLASGKACYEALLKLGYSVMAIDPLAGASLLDASGKFLASPPNDSSKTAVLTHSDATALSTALVSPDLKDVDVVFIGLHGGSGENGAIQCLLELAGKKFTGSGMTASAVAMNKAIAKRLFATEGILTPDWQLYRLTEERIDPQVLSGIADRFGFPLIVKPNDSGSTVGLTKVNAASDLRGALLKALKESRDVLVEDYIRGREMTVAVLDGEALPVVEIIPSNELYDYEAKYTKGKSRYVAPAPIDQTVAQELSSAAVKAYRVIGAAGLARVDFILAEDGRPFCLELNTLPGMTGLSLAPMAAKATGMSFEKLIERIIASALRD